MPDALTEAVWRYRLWRVAEQRFGKSPEELSEAESQQAGRIAERQWQLERAALGSAEASGVVLSEDYLEQAWQAFLAESDGESLQRLLDGTGMERQELRRQVALALRVEAVLAKVCADLPEVDDTELSLYYLNHPERFTQPVRYAARHILITINDDFAENTRSAAEARIQAIAKRVTAKPERFPEQALKHSECPTAMQGGLMGEIQAGTLYPELERALFALQPGQISPPVESPLGFHLLRCDAIEPAQRIPLEAAKPRLREALSERRRDTHRRRWLSEVMLRQSEERPNHG